MLSVVLDLRALASSALFALGMLQSAFLSMHMICLYEDLQSTPTTLYLQLLVGKLGKKADHFNFLCAELFENPFLYALIPAKTIQSKNILHNFPFKGVILMVVCG